MKSNYCTYCPMQTQCKYIKADGICEKAAAFEAGRRDKEKELPKNAIIIGGEVYEFDHFVTRGHNCSHCDLQDKCRVLYDNPLCSVFGPDGAEGSCFKKQNIAKGIDNVLSSPTLTTDKAKQPIIEVIDK